MLGGEKVGVVIDDVVAEAGLDTPAFPTLFNKQSTCVVGPDEPFHLPRASHVLDYEGELGLVIGRRCRHVSKEDAAQVIAGYTIVNDVTVRDWQLRIPTWTIGKSFDTHGPIGPWLVTADEVPDPQALDMFLDVNGERCQTGTTATMIFGVAEIVSHLSEFITLMPGDVISTGTPPGVGMGMKPPRFLQPGDTMRLGIGGHCPVDRRVTGRRGRSEHVPQGERGIHRRDQCGHAARRRSHPRAGRPQRRRFHRAGLRRRR